MSDNSGLLNLSDGSVSIELLSEEPEEEEQHQQQTQQKGSSKPNRNQHELVAYSERLLSGFATSDLLKEKGNEHFRQADLSLAAAAYSTSVDTLQHLIDMPEFPLLCRTTPALLEDAHVRLATALLNISQCHLSACTSKRKLGKNAMNSAFDCIDASCRASTLLDTLPRDYNKVSDLLVKAWYRTAAGSLKALGELLQIERTTSEATNNDIHKGKDRANSRTAGQQQRSKEATMLIEQARHSLRCLLSDSEGSNPTLSKSQIVKVKTLKNSLADMEEEALRIAKPTVAVQSKDNPSPLPVGRTRMFPSNFRVDVRTTNKGRGLFSTHACKPGTLVLVAYPYATYQQQQQQFTSEHSNNTSTGMLQQQQQNMQRVIEDVWLSATKKYYHESLLSIVDYGTLALTLQALKQRATDVNTNDISMGHSNPRDLKFCDIQDLISHFDALMSLKRCQELAAALHSLSLRLCEHPLACTDGLNAQTVSELILQVHFNSFPLQDESHPAAVATASHSRSTPATASLYTANKPISAGIGLFPAAAYVNHSGTPNVVYCVRRDAPASHINSKGINNSGSLRLELRALCFIHADEELVMAYVDPYLRPSEQAPLLTELGIPEPFGAALQMTKSEKTGPTSITKKKVCTPSGGGAPGIVYDELDKSLLALTQPRKEGTINGDDDISVLHERATAAHNAIGCMEKILPQIATLRLANCYLLFAQTLMLIDRRQQQQQQQQQQKQHQQNVSNITAAYKATYRIRLCCLGQDHPFVQDTLEGMTRTLQAIGFQFSEA